MRPLKSGVLAAALPAASSSSQPRCPQGPRGPGPLRAPPQSRRAGCAPSATPYQRCPSTPLARLGAALVRIPHRLHEQRRCPQGHLSLDASAADGKPCRLEQRPPLSRITPDHSPEGLVAAGRGGAAGNQRHVRPEGPEEGHRGTAPAAGGLRGLAMRLLTIPSRKRVAINDPPPAIEELPSENPGLTGARCGIRIPVTQRVALLLSSGSGDDQELTGGQDGARHHRAPRLARAVPPSP